MDISNEYILMLEKAFQSESSLKKDWDRLPSEYRLGTFIRWRSFLGIIKLKTKETKLVRQRMSLAMQEIAAIIPETLVLRTWLKEDEDIYVVENELEPYSDRGIPILRQDQLQILYEYSLSSLIYKFYEFVFGTPNAKLDEEKDKIMRYSLKFDTMEKLWFAFIMKEKFYKIWDGEKWIR